MYKSIENNKSIKQELKNLNYIANNNLTLQKAKDIFKESVNYIFKRMKLIEQTLTLTNFKKFNYTINQNNLKLSQELAYLYNSCISEIIVDKEAKLLFKKGLFATGFKSTQELYENGGIVFKESTSSGIFGKPGIYILKEQYHFLYDLFKKNEEQFYLIYFYNLRTINIEMIEFKLALDIYYLQQNFYLNNNINLKLFKKEIDKTFSNSLKNNLDKYKNNINKRFDFNKQLWLYVLNNENNSILEDFEKIKSNKIKKLIKDKINLKIESLMIQFKEKNNLIYLENIELESINLVTNHIFKTFNKEFNKNNNFDDFDFLKGFLNENKIDYINIIEETYINQFNKCIEIIDKEKLFSKIKRNIIDNISKKIKDFNSLKHRLNYDLILNMLNVCDNLEYHNLNEYIFNIIENLTLELNHIRIELENERLALKAKATIENIENYYKARAMKRHFTLLLGPTNSGKTYKALEKYKKSKNAIYLAPLRLLAREIYDKFNNELNISLITGEERLENENSTHITSTIEMLDLDKEYDFAIIDEIHMIGDQQRGNIWTKALLGLKAKEIFIVGSNSAENLIINLINKCNDTYDIINFERFNELESISQIDFHQINKGDAIICFSKNDIYSLSNKLNYLGFSTSVVYGNLPPSTRIKQVESFNNGETDVLISTDAIAMGLNLNIKRIIFSTVHKYDGKSSNILNIELFKQIIGRAGRYGFYEKGFYGFLKEDPHNYYYKNEARAFKQLDISINDYYCVKKGYFFPEFEHLENLSTVQDFSNNIYNILTTYSKYYYDKNNLFYLSDLEQKLDVAYILDQFDLSLKTKYNYLFTPYNKPKYEIGMNYYIFKMFLEEQVFFKNKTNFALKTFYEFYQNRDDKILLNNNKDVLEEIAKNLSLYLWLYYKSPSFDYNISLNYLNLYEDISLELNKKILNVNKKIKSKKEY